MSLADQLQNLKKSVVNVFDVNIKNKKSLILEDSSSIGRSEAHKKYKKEFKKLCKLDHRFTQFENLYSKESVDLVPQLLKEEQFNAIKNQVKLFLCLVTPYLETDFVIYSIEWLVYKFEIHIHQPEDILMCCLPYHNEEIFIKFIRLIDVKRKEFAWLENISKEGRKLLAIDLSAICMKNLPVLEMICSWPMQYIDITTSDDGDCKELCHVITCLGLNIVEKIKLFNKDKIEKYLNPFIRLITQSLTINHENINSSAMIMLLKFSEVLSLNRKFLNSTMKKIMKSDSINVFFGLQIVLDVCNNQEIVLKPKLDILFQENFVKLTEKEKTVIEKIIAENISYEEEQFDKTETIMVVDEVKPKVKLVKKDKTLLKIDMKTICIDWEKEDVEMELIKLVNKYVGNWEDVNNDETIKNKHYLLKLGRKVLELIQKKPEQLKIKYREGGLVSHLCLALMNPDFETKTLVLKLIKLFAHQWNNRSKFEHLKSGILQSDPNCLYYDIYNSIILEEINHICKESQSSTITITTLSMINTKNLQLVTTLSNIWQLVLTTLKSNSSVEVSNYMLRDALKQCLTRIQQVYPTLSTEHQQSILDSITIDIDRQLNNINSATDFLSHIPMTIDNIKYLLNDVIPKETKMVKGQTKKFNSKPLCYSTKLQDKITVVLATFSRRSNINMEEELQLIEPLNTILNTIVNNQSMTKPNDNEDNNKNVIELVTNLMQSILNILTTIKDSKETIILDTISKRISLELFSKCLYLFQNAALHELNLAVIQTIVKLGLGMEQFNLIYFISWIGNHLVPREDENSLSILNNIINETLPLCIKQKKENSYDKVQIIANFVRECANLPKHRVLLFFKSIVNSLSLSENNNDINETVLWIQLLFMITIKANNNQNESLILPLLNRFTMEEQMISLKKLISFISLNINDNNRKRKFNDLGISNSPISKKRKTSIITLSDKTTSSYNEDKDFASVKENLLTIDNKMDSINLLRTVLKYCLIHVKEISDKLNSISDDIIKDFISIVFVSMKQISASTIASDIQNEFCQSLRQIIESVGCSLSRNTYLSLIVDLALTSNDGVVKSKCLELLSNKLSILTSSKGHIELDNEIVEFARSLLPMTVNIIVKQTDSSSDWNSSLLCVTNLVALGLSSKDGIEKSCETIFNHLLKSDLLKMGSEKVLITNLFFKHYISCDHYNDLSTVFNSCLNIIDKCITTIELNNGLLESSLVLMNCIICRPDSHTIGWQSFTNLLMKLFDLATIDSKLKQMSRQSCEYQKNIRIKLSKMSDTKSLIATCIVLTDAGITKDNLTYISGSISLFGCHLGHLNKSTMKYTPTNEESDILWKFLYQSLSINEVLVNIKENNLHSIEEISIKALNQLCHLYQFDSELLVKLISWAQKSDLSKEYFVNRNIVFFKFITHLVVRSGNNKDKIIEFINNSDYIIYASNFLKHLSVEIKSKNKRRKSQSTIVIAYESDKLIQQCPKQCAELIISICDSLYTLLIAENKCGMNMSISDETIDLIGNVCKNMLTIDIYLEKEQYKIITEKHMIPLIVQLATNSFNDEALLTPLAMGLCKHFSELSNAVHLAILKTLVDLKTCLGDIFDSSIRSNVSSFLEDCKLHDDETIADMANDI